MRRRPRTLAPAGVLAQHDGQCWMCDRPITRLVTMVTLRKDEWIHTSCAPGGDE